MELIIFLAVGALAGYLGGQLIGTANSLLVNIIVGIIGSMLGGKLFGDLFSDLPSIGSFSLGGLITAVLGSAILLWAINFIQAKKK
ncbi:MAG: GlsB/YeaQ/YmgE family stress response membrane protein [Paludibacteraceae bacterium]|nr:GlsB/YeaQ/YmgE family stress response membrane protein [Paludibacteraceae bacterium]